MFDFTFILIIDCISILSLIFLERKKPVEALAWILVVVFLPILGVLLYIFFGDTISLKFQFKFYKNKELDESITTFIDYQKQLLQYQNLPQVKEEYKDILYMIMNQNKSSYTLDNKVEIIVDGHEYKEKLFNDIKNAKKSICIAYYIISNNKMGHEFMQLLIDKANEGIEVRVIYDFIGGFFMQYFNRYYFKKLKKAGGKVFRFLPSFWSSLLRINYRYHRKMAIIDSKIGYTGGFNIGDEYLGLRKSCTPWRDTQIRVEGDVVFDLLVKYIQDYEYVRSLSKNAPKEEYEHLFTNLVHSSPGEVCMQLVACGPEIIQEEIKDAYIKMINKASKYVYIQTPYFIPDESIMTALRLAINSGVDVKIIIPGIPDKSSVYLASLSFVYDLLELGIEVYTYNGFIHAKNIIIDDYVVSIGSTNIDVRSFALNFEINSFIFNEKFATHNKEIFLNDIKHSTLYTMEKYKNRPAISRLGSHIFRLFSTIM